jgi:hydrogenase-4 component B
MVPGRRYSALFAGVAIAIIALVSSAVALGTLFEFSGNPGFTKTIINGIAGSLIVCDKLSAFFILVINFTVITGFLHSTGYLQSYEGTRPASWNRLHYFAYVVLHASMIMVPLFRNGFWFLVVWETMTISSFILVIYDYNVKGTLKAGLSYLIQMHIGMLIILAALIISSKGAKSVSFDNLTAFFKENANWPLFFLFFAGFGLKAGFFPLHTWLPEAHPAAPSYISGVMSGVMIKLGIYGILRVTSYLVNDLEVIGSALIIISSVTGLFGVMMAILQHDIKKLLAYHSIENIGIIGLGIGLGIYGTASGNGLVSAAGYAGALLHTLNHSIFKSLLFYSAGSVISRLHVQNIEKMGGLMKVMPYTAWAFLIGSVAIAGLPPLNGFISEFLIYSSLFAGLSNPQFSQVTIIFIGISSLVLIGGMALLCFTKVFGVVFLGHPRSSFHDTPREVGKTMLSAKLLPVIIIFLTGFFPVVFVRPLMSVVNSVFGTAAAFSPGILYKPLNLITLSFLVLFFLAVFVFALRKIFTSGRNILYGPTWGCGYTATDSRQQYTASSFIQEYASLIKPLIRTGFSNVNYDEKELFPQKREFHTHSDDLIKSRLIFKPAGFIVNIMRRAAVFQTGRLQHYVLYVLLFLLLIFFLTVLNII